MNDSELDFIEKIGNAIGLAGKGLLDLHKLIKLYIKKERKKHGQKRGKNS